MTNTSASLLDTVLVYKILKDTFPAQNDYVPSTYQEELQELRHFGINTDQDLVDLLQKHRQKILEIDASPIDEKHEKLYREEYGDAEIDECLAQGFWFAFPALLRIALELEFGDEYDVYADARDGI